MHMPAVALCHCTDYRVCDRSVSPVATTQHRNDDRGSADRIQDLQIESWGSSDRRHRTPSADINQPTPFGYETKYRETTGVQRQYTETTAPERTMTDEWE